MELVFHLLLLHLSPVRVASPTLRLVHVGFVG